MKKENTRRYRWTTAERSVRGFTLIELLVAMVVASIVLGAIISTYLTTSKSYTLQREMARMQQNLQAAMYLIKNDLRNAGRGGSLDGTVGLVQDGSVITWDPIAKYNADADDANGYPGISMSSYIDSNNNGRIDDDEKDTTRVVRYWVDDPDGDGRRGLYRQDASITANVWSSTGWDLVFDGIEDISFAYAFDNDQDLELDRNGTAVIWGIDTNSQAGLDTNADSNGDGDIDASDDSNGDDIINTTDGSLGGVEIELARIKAVRIWLLARSRVSYPDFTDNSTYALGHKLIDMSDAANVGRRNFRHKMLTGAVALQNRQWLP